MTTVHICHTFGSANRSMVTSQFLVMITAHRPVFFSCDNFKIRNKSQPISTRVHQKSTSGLWPYCSRWLIHFFTNAKCLQLILQSNALQRIVFIQSVFSVFICLICKFECLSVVCRLCVLASVQITYVLELISSMSIAFWFIELTLTDIRQYGQHGNGSVLQLLCLSLLFWFELFGQQHKSV